jgi:hypothetical protein
VLGWCSWLTIFVCCEQSAFTCCVKFTLLPGQLCTGYSANCLCCFNVMQAKRAQQLQLAWAQVIMEVSSLRERMVASLSSASNVKKRNHWQVSLV